MSDAPGAAPHPPQGTAPGSRPRSWRLICFVSAVALVGSATVWLPYLSRVATDPLHPPAILTARWWATPIELRAESRLARVDADLLAIAAAPDGKQVFAAGRHGTLLASEDGGATWTPERVLVAPPQFPAPAKPAEPAKPATPEVAKPENSKPAGGAAAKGSVADRAAADRKAREEAKRRAAEEYRRAGATPIPPDRPGNREPPRPTGTTPPPATDVPSPPTPKPGPAPLPNAPARPNEQRDTKGKEAATKAGLDIFGWLVPEAHAAEPPLAAPAPAPPAAGPATAAPAVQAALSASAADEALVALQDDIVWLGFWLEVGSHPIALISPGFAVERTEDHRWRSRPRAEPRTLMQRLVSPTARLVSTSGWRGLHHSLLSNGAILTHDFQPEVDLPRARAIAWTRNESRLLAVADDRVWRLENKAWRPLGAPALVPLRGLHFVDDERGWVVGQGGQLLRTDDGGEHWTACETPAPVPLNAVFFRDDKHGWVVGNDGYIATSDDGGATLVSRTRPRTLAAVGAPLTFPPPWYLASWMLAVGLFLVGRSIPAAKEAKTARAVMQAFTSDRPLEKGEPDVLRLSDLASGLSRFLRNDATKPPLTVAITGPWGTGKSSLMNLLRADLRSFGFNPVWFNAWHHQKEEHLLASLLQAIRSQAIPAVWRPEGLMFRAHLLLIRARKHAFKILLLLFVSGALLGSETVSAKNFENVHKVLATLQAWVDHLLDPKAFEEPATSVWNQLAGLGLSHLPGLGAFATLGVGLFRGLRAFGLNPGALLATAASSIKLADLDAQSSFRDKFRTEYGEVARALGVRTLLIFIDDLDRCQPEQVLDVLESVNYLVTSGDCFVILGVDRSRVEPCVAIGFKDISAEISGKDDPEHRQQYAVQYLDKLINIEVPIPSLDPSEARALLAPRTEPDAAAAAAAAGGKRLRSRLGKTVAELRDILRPSFRLWPFAVAVLAFFAGFGMERRMPGKQSSAASAVAAGAKQTAPVAGENAQAPKGGGAPKNEQETPKTENKVSGLAALSEVAKAIEAEIAKRPTQLGQFEAALPAHTQIGWLFWLFVVAWGGFLLYQIAGSRPELVVKDSDEFVEAWKAWSPIVFSHAKTPRALKRFQNRVRFLSMRQQAGEDERGWARRLLDRLLRRRNEAEDRKAAAPAPVSPEEQPIPDPVLVELAAIHLHRRNLFDEISDAGALAAQPELMQIAATVAAACDDARKPRASDWPWHPRAVAEDIIAYREPFLARQSGVRTH